jgi:NADPH:quinone reductase-like Zn-dependent oxidoreductase
MSGETQALSLPLLREGGILVSVLPYPIQSERLDRGEIRALTRNVKADGADLAQVLQLLVEGKIRTDIQTVLPFAQIVQAHQLVESRHTRGKIVLNQVH